MDRSTKPTFNFVHLTHPDDLKNEETQLRIRRLAMTEVGKARRKPKTRRERNEIVLEFRAPAEPPPEIERFGGGQTDPFGPYPIPLDDNSRNLIANIFRSNSAHARQLRGSWYPVGLSYAPAFLNMLANSQLFLLKEHNGYFPSTDDALSLSYHHRALRIAADYMKDPMKHTSDEVIASVTSFMCHHYILGSFAGWEKHRSALLKSIELRGGFNTVTLEHLRVTISWADLAGAFSQDIPPVVPLPRQWEQDSKSPPHSPRPFSAIALAWKKQMPMRLDWITIFDDVIQLVSLDRAFTEEQLTAAVTSGCWMEPTMYRLLAIRPLNLGRDSEHVIEEVCRLGTLIFLSPIWRSLGASPVWTCSLTRNLLTVLHEHMVEWNELKQLLIWTLYFAAVEARDLGERSQFVFMLAVLMSGLRLEEWDQLLQIVKSVLWVDRVFAGSDELFRDEVMQIVNQKDMGGILGEIRADMPGEMEDV